MSIVMSEEKRQPMPYEPAQYRDFMAEQAEAASACSEFLRDEDDARDDGGMEMLGALVGIALAIGAVGALIVVLL